jgi:hypothetical protein
MTLELEQESIALPSQPAFHSEAEAPQTATRTILTAVPSKAHGPFGSFSLSRSEQTSEVPLPAAPTFPGF